MLTLVENHFVRSITPTWYYLGFPDQKLRKHRAADETGPNLLYECCQLSEIALNDAALSTPEQMRHGSGMRLEI